MLSICKYELYKTAKPKKTVEKVLTVEKKCGNIIKLSVIPMRKKRKGLVKSSEAEIETEALRLASFIICSKEIYKVLIDKRE